MAKKKKQQEEFNAFVKTIDELINSKEAAENRVYEYEGKMHQYHQQLWEMQQENARLIRENESIRILLDKEQDTQLIKYQGKIYKITSTAHFSDINEPDTLDINATYCGEVNEDGESKM